MATELLTMKHLEPFAPTVCWLRTQVGDNFVGIYVGMKIFQQSSGDLNLRYMRMVARNNKTRHREVIGERQSFTFPMDRCITDSESHHGLRRKIETAQGDVVFLSREMKDVHIILGLIMSGSSNGNGYL